MDMTTPKVMLTKVEINEEIVAMGMVANIIGIKRKMRKKPIKDIIPQSSSAIPSHVLYGIRLSVISTYFSCLRMKNLTTAKHPDIKRINMGIKPIK